MICNYCRNELPTGETFCDKCKIDLADDTTAFDTLREWAKNGYAEAQGLVGKIYLNGSKAAQRDYTQAKEWLDKASMQNDATGLYGVGAFYYNGYNGTPKNSEKAREYANRSVQLGSLDGMRLMGHLFRDGFGNPQNDTEALRWYRVAADKGSVYAMDNIGLMYDQGRGVSQNSTEAFRWYRMAADKGSSYAMDNIGWMYDQGRGVPQNSAEAFRWYRMAAEKGNVDALIRIGFCYEKGSGVSPNLSMASDIITKAAIIDPVYYNDRAWFYYRQGNFDMAMLDWYLYYETHEPKNETIDGNPDWTNYLNRHFFDQGFPRIKLAGERYIYRSPCYIIYNYQKSKSVYDGNSFTNMSGTYSTGYYVITDQSIYLFNSVNLSRSYPAVKRNNLVRMILGRTSLSFKPIDSDSCVHIPYNTIQNYFIDNEGGLVISAGIQPQVYGYYSDGLSFITAAIHQSQQGGFSRKKPETSGTNGVDALKKLKELLDSGVLSQSEYEEYKNKTLKEMGF